MTGDPRDSGFSSVPLLVVVLAAMTSVFLVCLEAGNVAYSWFRAQQAAAAGAAAIGGDPGAEDVASAALSKRLRATATVRVSGRTVLVTVRPPALTPLGGVAQPVTGRAVGLTGLPDQRPEPSASSSRR